METNNDEIWSKIKIIIKKVEIPAEVLKLLGEEGIEELWHLCNEMYNSGN